MEAILQVIADAAALTLEAISVSVVFVGGIQAAWRSIGAMTHADVSHGLRRQAWLSLARWLLLGLEFMLAADVIRSVIAPNWTAIGQLAAVAVIRTFLNFFLERDLEEASHAPEAA